MRNLTRAIGAAAATTALGAAAMFLGVATQDPVPASPVVLAADADDNGDASAEAIAILNAEIDPEGWARIVGDGR